MSAGPAADRGALVAVDLGAESCRVSLLRRAGATLTVQLVHRFANGPVQHQGDLRWPWQAIEEGVFAGLRQCAALAPEGIRALAVDGWAVDYVRLADRVAAASPFCYRDERTIAAEEHVHARNAPRELRRLTGVQTQRINTAYQLVADRLAGAPAGPWLNLPEYLLYRMGAEPVAEWTNASHTQLMAAGRMQWSPQAFRLLGLDTADAPRLVPPGTVVGCLAGPLAQLPALRQTLLIAPACHDTASAIAGIGAEGEDWAYISSGTWSLVGTVLDAPETGATALQANYTNLAAAGGRVLFHKGITGMWLLRECMQAWGGLEISELLEQSAQVAPPPVLLDLDDPALMLQGDMPARIAAQMRHAGEAAPETPAACAALIFHSLARRYVRSLEEIQMLTGRRIERVYVVGGGSRNTLINSLLARASGLPVVRGAVESSTLGNFAVQLALLQDGEASAGNVARWSRRLEHTLG